MAANTDKRFPTLVLDAVHDRLIFDPVPPGNASAVHPVELPSQMIEVDATEGEVAELRDALGKGALSAAEIESVKGVADGVDVPDVGDLGQTPENDWQTDIQKDYQLARLSLLAVGIIDRLQKTMLDVEPLTRLQFCLTGKAKAALLIGWLAIVKRGRFPLDPQGVQRMKRIQAQPCGAMHFVSASDRDAGYLYTMGIGLSPEAQALRTTEASYGLDGELIVPGQAVSPIPPFLAMATRLFAASVATSSNISEEEQSIPIRNFPHPAAIDDLAPVRGGRFKPAQRPSSPEDLATDLRVQLVRYQSQTAAQKTNPEDEFLPAIGAVYDATQMSSREIVHAVSAAWRTDPSLREHRHLTALYLDLEPTAGNRVETIAAVVDAAAELGLRYVAVADDTEDAWLPNLLEYLDADELNDVADYADAKGVMVVDGRPVDPVYTAATAAQRIQSVFTTLSVDVLKMGMWLCLDALTARRVWNEIRSNPHFPEHMLLMPIGIVEPWNAFCDNRDRTKTARAIIDPYEKIVFMIEEAELLGMPSLLTDTRHKATWVLLGRRTPHDEPHPREKFVYGPHQEIIGRTADSARPLLSWDQFMECERQARRAGIFLGQAGSVEIDQLFRIISETTYDAAKDGKNPATAVWTAETERVLRTRGGSDLQSQRSAAIAPFLAVYNRGIESHAKLDGWLRYLEDGGGSLPLRGELNDARTKLDTLLDALMAAQHKEAGIYHAAFSEFRNGFLDYHRAIRENFVAIRDKVGASWTASSK